MENQNSWPQTLNPLGLRSAFSCRCCVNPFFPDRTRTVWPSALPTMQRKAHGSGQGLAGASRRSELSHGQDGGHAVGGQGHVLVRRVPGQLGEDLQAEVGLLVLQRAQGRSAQSQQQEGVHAKHSGREGTQVWVWTVQMWVRYCWDTMWGRLLRRNRWVAQHLQRLWTAGRCWQEPGNFTFLFLFPQ